MGNVTGNPNFTEGLQESGGALKSVATSQVRLDTGNGHGSTNTRVRRFTNASTIGSAITHATSATDGDSLTINEDGIYSISYSDRVTSTSGRHGVSINGAGTTSISSLTTSERLISTYTITTTNNCSATVRLSSSDVIRPHTDGFGNESTDADVQFVITQVARL